MNNRTKLVAAGVMLLAAALGAAPVARQATNSPAGNTPANSGTAGTNAPTSYMGLTEPSVSAKLGFDIRGVVAKVDVKRNDKVKAGQPLLALNDKEEQALLRQYLGNADVKLQVAEAEQTFNVKNIDWQRKVSMFQKNQVATDFEVKTAEAEKNIAQIKIDQAKHQGEVYQAQADAQAARIEKMHKLSPIDGEIRDVIVKPGEQVDETKPVIEIVQLDPLYVEVKLVDSNVVQKLKLGDKVQVKYSDESTWRTAEVESIDPSADARTQTHPFRLKLANPEGRNAGLRVEIQLAPTVAKAE